MAMIDSQQSPVWQSRKLDTSTTLKIEMEYGTETLKAH
jgi:hypothetical protein